MGNEIDLRESFKSRYSVWGTSWDKRVITYSFENFTSDLPNATVRGVLNQAFSNWSQHASLDFIEVCGTSDFVVGWVNGVDPDEFPGAFSSSCSGAIGHAFYPPVYEEPWADKMHFKENSNVNWVQYQSQSSGNCDFSLLSIGMHELGHVFGLLHSDDENDLMWAYNNGTEVLSQDNINGVKSLYGSRTNPIQGPDLFCTTGTYYLEDYSDIVGNVSYLWTVPSGVTIVSGQGTGSVTIDPNYNNYGNISISVQVTGCGDPLTFTRTIYNGTPKISITGVDGGYGGTYNNICPTLPSHSLTVSLINDSNNCVDDWNDYNTTATSSESCTQFNFTLQYNGANNPPYNSATVNVKASNSCGISTKNVYFIPNSSSCGYSYFMQSSPNPSNGWSKIEVFEVQDTEGITTPVEFQRLEVLNSQGERMYYDKSESIEKVINTEAFKSGLYYILAWVDNQKISSTLVVK